MIHKDKKYQRAFAKHMKKLRLEREWTQSQLAAQADVNVNQISRIENGKNAVNLHTIRALAVALGKEPYKLLKFKFDLKLNTDFSAHHRRLKVRPTTETINKLVGMDFFRDPQSVSQVLVKCRLAMNVSLKSAAVSAVLTKLVKQKVLKRMPSKTKGRFLYVKN